MRHTASATNDAGFSMVELLAATLLTLVVVGAAIALANPHSLAAQLQPESVDAQQRLRVGADVLYRDLYLAGAGLDAGPLSGPLGDHLPPVIPRRTGRSNPDAHDLVRQDAITLVHVPLTSSQTALAGPLSPSGVDLLEMPGCPLGRPPCGFAAGDGLVVFDDRGDFDLFTVLAINGAQAAVRHLGQQGPYPFPAGARAAAAEVRTYYFDASARQLRSYDGDSTDTPVVDGVSRLAFEYFGSPQPPRTPRPPPGVANCLYDAAGSPQPALTTLAAGADGVAVLPPALLNDGPWCGAGDYQFDADLLRIRRVRVTLAVRMATTFRSGRDVSVTFDVSPRTLAGQP